MSNMLLGTTLICEYGLTILGTTTCSSFACNSGGFESCFFFYDSKYIICLNIIFYLSWKTYSVTCTYLIHYIITVFSLCTTY